MDAKKFGAFIAAVRKEQGMTQAELAGMLNVTDKAVSRWERGLGFPDINSIEPLADALGLSVLELMRSEKLSADQRPAGGRLRRSVRYAGACKAAAQSGGVVACVTFSFIAENIAHLQSLSQLR